MKAGDLVKMFNIRDKTIDNTLYKIVEVRETSIKLKHPKIDGHFIFAKKNIAEVIPAFDEEKMWKTWGDK